MCPDLPICLLNDASLRQTALLQYPSAVRQLRQTNDERGSLRGAVSSHALLTAQSQLLAVYSKNTERKINILIFVRIIIFCLNVAPRSRQMRCGAEFILPAPSVTLTERSIPRQAECRKYLWHQNRVVTTVQVPAQCFLLKFSLLCGFRVSG